LIVGVFGLDRCGEGGAAGDVAMKAAMVEPGGIGDLVELDIVEELPRAREVEEFRPSNL
jgi:hypothetical protein